MNCVYLANVVIDPDDIPERVPAWAEAGRLRAMEMLGLLAGSGLFRKIHLVAQGRGRKRGWYAARTVDKGTYTVVYLPVLAYGAFIRNLSAIVLTTWWLIRHVKKRDVVVAYNGDPMKAVPVLLTRFVLRFRLVMQFEELYNGLGLKFTLHKIFERIMARIADGFVVSSVGTRDQLHLPRDPKRLASSSGYTPVYPDVCRGAPTAESTPLGLLYAGKLDEERGLREFIDLFLATKGDAKLVITGSGPLEAHVRRMAAREERLEYLGMLPEPDFAAAVRDAFICVNPQPTDHRFTNLSFPSKVVNFLSQGKPVLTTKTVSLLGSPYGDMVVFYDDRSVESLQMALDWIGRNKLRLATEAEQFPGRVRAIKRQEELSVRRVLENVCA